MNQPGAFPLLDLPGELRNLIYHFAFTPHLAPSTADSDHEPQRNSSSLNLLLTCRQIHHEARLLAFPRTTFILADLSYRDLERSIRQRVARLRPDALECITYTAVSFSTPTIRHTVDLAEDGSDTWAQGLAFARSAMAMLSIPFQLAALPSLKHITIMGRKMNAEHAQLCWDTFTPRPPTSTKKDPCNWEVVPEIPGKRYMLKDVAHKQGRSVIIEYEDVEYREPMFSSFFSVI